MSKCNKIFIDSIYFYCHIHRNAMSVLVYVGDYKSRDQCETIVKATEITAGGLEDGNRIFPFSESGVWEKSARRERERDGEMESKWNLLAEED